MPVGINVWFQVLTSIGISPTFTIILYFSFLLLTKDWKEIGSCCINAALSSSMDPILLSVTFIHFGKWWFFMYTLWLWMQENTYRHTYTYAYTYARTHTHTSTHTHKHTQTHTYTYTHRYACTRARRHARTHSHTHTKQIEPVPFREVPHTRNHYYYLFTLVNSPLRNTVCFRPSVSPSSRPSPTWNRSVFLLSSSTNIKSLDPMIILDIHKVKRSQYGSVTQLAPLHDVSTSGTCDHVTAR